LEEDAGLPTLDIFAEVEVDLDVQLRQIKLPLLDRILVNSKVLDLILLDRDREVGCAISRQRDAVHRSKGLLDLREGDTRRQRNALLDPLRLTHHDVQISISVIEFPGSFGWYEDEDV
jgi:hypothetical protein